jgi:hypothetical protein
MAREDKLRSAIVRELDDFRERYEPLTPEEIAWSHAVTAWLPAWCAWADSEPDGTAPPVPSLDTPATATVDQVGMSKRDLAEKRWEWRRLWARTQGFIAAFKAKQPSATEDDRAWVGRVEQDMRTLLAASLRELMLAHPGMGIINDIDGAEIVRALYGAGEYDDDDEIDDELDDEDVAGPEHLPS